MPVTGDPPYPLRSSLLVFHLQVDLWAMPWEDLSPNSQAPFKDFKRMSEEMEPIGTTVLAVMVRKTPIPISNMS